MARVEYEVVITVPVGTDDEADARESALDLLARAVAKAVTQRWVADRAEVRAWLAEHGRVELRRRELKDEG